MTRVIDALLTTVADDLATRASQTIAPQNHSRATAHAFLQQLRERGRAVELRTGRPIGEGGMGTVYEAEQVALGRLVAIKTLRPDRADPIAAQDLLREAWVTGALEHPNVVPIHHLEIDGDRPLLIMTRVDGIEWSALVHDADEVARRFGTTDLLGWNLGILGQLLHALRFAHSRGILHRDLKPANVMIGSFGEVYLLDWGIAVSLRDDATGRFPLASEATELAGTPAYMAPEMLGAEVGIPLGEYTDVYVAGAVLYEIVVGHPPHRAPSTPAMIASIVASDPQIPASVPAELAQICRRALQANPGDRYASIAELQAALRGYLEHRGSAQLSARARDRLDELLVLCDGEPSDSRREQIYHALAVCRFGFHEALAAWRDNAEARAGLVRATAAVAEYELRAGDPRAAVSLLTELGEHHPLLDAAQSAAAAHARRQQELAKLAADHDPTPGLRLRWGLALAIGGIYSIAPIVREIVPELAITAHVHQLAVALVSLVLVVLFGLWWRTRTPFTAVNRTIFQTAILLFLGNAIVVGGSWQLGLSVPETQAVLVFFWAAIGGMLAITFDGWLVIGAIGHLCGFLITVRAPHLAPYAIAATNLVFTIVVAVRWRIGKPRSPLSAA